MISEPNTDRRESTFWDRFWANPEVDNARRATLTISADLTVEMLAKERVERILDLGCGLGEVALMVARKSAAQILAVDVSERAVEVAQQAVRSAGRTDQVQVVRADCYRLGFADASFDAVISFGYASAASYEGAEREVARVLRPGGVAIVDFRNLSIYNTLLNPRAGWRIWRRYRRKDKVYHLGPEGLREHFGPSSLHLEDVRYFNTYPPMGSRLTMSTYLKLEQAGRVVGRPLARVLAAKFRRGQAPT